METITFPICLEHYKISKDSCCNDANVPLTIRCIGNIEALGHTLEDFAVAGEYDEEDIRGNEEWWIDSMFKKGNKFYKINVKRRTNKDCIFLKKEKGCVLGENRPVVCKIYPFWINENGKINYEEGEKEYCPLGITECSVPQAMKLMGETEKGIRSYFELMKEDCIKNKRRHIEILLSLLNKNYIQTAV